MSEKVNVGIDELQNLFHSKYEVEPLRDLSQTLPLKGTNVFGGRNYKVEPTCLFDVVVIQTIHVHENFIDIEPLCCPLSNY